MADKAIQQEYLCLCKDVDRFTTAGRRHETITSKNRKYLHIDYGELIDGAQFKLALQSS